MNPFILTIMIGMLFNTNAMPQRHRGNNFDDIGLIIGHIMQERVQRQYDAIVDKTERRFADSESEGTRFDRLMSDTD